MNFLCNIVVSSFVFFLSQFFTSACYVLHIFTIFPTQSTQGAFTGLIDVVLHIVCPDCLLLCATHNNDSVPTFKSPLDSHCQAFSLSTFSVVSLMNCPCIRFSLHFSFSSFAFCFLNSTLVIVSLALIVSAADTPLIRFFFRISNIES